MDSALNFVSVCAQRQAFPTLQQATENSAAVHTADPDECPPTNAATLRRPISERTK